MGPYHTLPSLGISEGSACNARRRWLPESSLEMVTPKSIATKSEQSGAALNASRHGGSHTVSGSPHKSGPIANPALSGLTPRSGGLTASGVL